MAPATKPEARPIDLDLPDDYVKQELLKEKDLQPITWDYAIRNLQWLSIAILTITPSIAIYGAFTTELKWQTLAWCVVYYFITGLGTSHFNVIVVTMLKVVQVSPRDTTDCGHIGHTTRRQLFSTSSPRRALVR